MAVIKDKVTEIVIHVISAHEKKEQNLNRPPFFTLSPLVLPLFYLLRFGYSILLIPFAVEYDFDRKVFYLKSSSCLKVLVAFAQILSIVGVVAVVPSLGEGKEPFDALIFPAIIGLYYLWTFTVFVTFWRKGEYFVHSVNELARTCELCQRLKIAIPSKLKTTVLLGLGIVFIISWTIYEHGLIQMGVLKSHVTFEGVLSELKGQARSGYKNVPLLQNAPDELAMTFFFGTLWYLSISDHFGQWLLLSICVTSKIILRALLQHLRSNEITASQKEEILNAFYHIRSFIETTNSAISWIVLSEVFLTCPYFAYSMKDLMQHSYHKRLAICVYIILYFSILLLAAEVCSLVRAFGKWLRQTCESSLVSKDKFICQRASLLIQEIAANEIGVTGGNALTITYGFVGSMLSLILTYGVIIVQYKS